MTVLLYETICINRGWYIVSRKKIDIGFEIVYIYVYKGFTGKDIQVE